MSHTGCQKEIRYNHYGDRHHDDHHNDYICSRFLCDNAFRLRLGGLQCGLNFRLRQLIGCIVRLDLEGDKKIVAYICYVGSDFVEVDVIKLKEKLAEPIQETQETVADEIAPPQTYATNKKKHKKRHRKNLIIPFSTINYVELIDD